MSKCKQTTGFFNSIVGNKAIFCRNRTIVLFLCFCFLMSAAIPAEAALQGLWKLDETSGTSAADSSGNSRTGTLQNMAGTEWDTGIIDGALEFDGTNDYISMPRVSVLETGNASTHYLSATAWIKDYSGGAAGWGTVAGTGDGGWLFARNGSSELLGAYWLTSGGLVTSSVSSSSVNISDGEWHYAALVYNGSSVSLYVDNERTLTTTSGGSIQNLYNKGVLVGENAGATGRYWDGVLDDVRIYDHALTGAEVAQMYGPNPANASFEYPNISGHAYNPSGIDWSYAGGTFVLSHNGSAYSSTAYSGDQVVVLQNVVSISQAISGFEIGQDYVVSWAEANRPSPYGGNDFRVLMDSTVIYATHTVPSTSWTVRTATFTATATTHTLKFDALNTGGGDKSVFVDDVMIEEDDSETPPGAASSPSPANSATNVPVSTDLSWTAGAGTDSHYVYFGTDSTPDSGEYQGEQSGTTCDVGLMDNSTTYYWRIDEVNDYGTTTGTVWSFTTAQASVVTVTNAGFEYPVISGYAYNPSGTSWEHAVGYLILSHDGSAYSSVAYSGTQVVVLQNVVSVYQSVSGFEVGKEYTVSWAEADRPSPYGGNDFRVLIDNTVIYSTHTATSTSWALKTSAEFEATSTTHTLKFDALNTGGGDKSVFIDGITIAQYNPDSPPGAATGPSPANSASYVAVNADLSWTAGAGATSHNVYFGTASPGTSRGNQTATTYDTGTMTEDTIYYWRIDEVNAYGTTTGTVWSFTTTNGEEQTTAIAYWPLNETSGSTAYNSVSSINGTLVNMDNSDWVTGMIGGALDFDGVNDYVTMARSSVLETGNATTHKLSVSAWIKSDLTSPPTGYTAIVGTGDGGWVLCSFPNSNQIVFACWLLNGSSGQTALVANTTPVFDGNWHHVTGVFDGGSLHLYVDGTGAEIGTVGGTIRNIYDRPVLLGENAYATGRYWDGRIDDVKIFDTALTAEEAYHLSNPANAYNPDPVHNAIRITTDAELIWSAGSGATSHNVYFGTDSTPDSGESKGNQTSTAYDPGTLAANTNYYWRIDEVGGSGTITGMVWSFSTSLPRVIISSDIGGWDNDDKQSMVHYFTYANMFDTEGLISSPPGPGRASDILAVINYYETDYSNLSAHGSFPTPNSLRDVTKQGAIDPAPSAGYSTATDGSNWIITRANVSDARPLWVLTWGSITDVAQAVHDNPGIKSKIRVLYTGSWNTSMDPYARAYLYNNHSDMWWIEINSTMRGMYEGGNQTGDLEGSVFRDTHVCGHGALGDYYCTLWTDEPLKMGDTPEVMYLLNGNPDVPTLAHWGGMYMATSHGSQYWTDLTDSIYREGDCDGAKTVNIWREAYLRDWQGRMDWADGQ